MSTDIDWPALVRDAYAMAREKGWYDPEPSVGEYIALMHSEVSEALEAYRKVGDFGVHYDCTRTDYSGGVGYRVSSWMPWHEDFERLGPYSTPIKPEGVPIELADLVILIADFCGAMKLQPPDGMEGDEAEGLPHFLCEAHYQLSMAWGKWNSQRPGVGLVWDVVADVCAFCERHGIDLAAAIRLKMAYNATLPMRHGGKHL